MSSHTGRAEPRIKTSMRFSRAELEMLDAVGDHLRERHGGRYSRTGAIRWFLGRYPLPKGAPEDLSHNERAVVDAHSRLQEES